ncbi:MAG TPA: hypothetical protein PL110_14030, partial [Candidatus Eremiobacteraeota bacterium]|nr:hypothetical protein [Candidatus Eremiobacteraeota bacterium]
MHNGEREKPDSEKELLLEKWLVAKKEKKLAEKTKVSPESEKDTEKIKIQEITVEEKNQEYNNKSDSIKIDIKSNVETKLYTKDTEFKDILDEDMELINQEKLFKKLEEDEEISLLREIENELKMIDSKKTIEEEKEQIIEIEQEIRNKEAVEEEIIDEEMEKIIQEELKKVKEELEEQELIDKELEKIIQEELKKVKEELEEQ